MDPYEVWTCRNSQMLRASFFTTVLEKERLDDWGVRYDMCPDCGAKILEKYEIVLLHNLLRKDPHEKLPKRTLV